MYQEFLEEIKLGWWCISCMYYNGHTIRPIELEPLKSFQIYLLCIPKTKKKCKQYNINFQKDWCIAHLLQLWVSTVLSWP